MKVFLLSLPEVIIVLVMIHSGLGSTESEDCNDDIGNFLKVSTSPVQFINTSRTFRFKLNTTTNTSEFLKLYLLPSEDSSVNKLKSPDNLQELEISGTSSDTTYMQIVPVSYSLEEQGMSLGLPLYLRLTKSEWTNLRLSVTENDLELCGNDGVLKWCLTLVTHKEGKTWQHIQLKIPPRNYIIVDYCAEDEAEGRPTFLNRSKTGQDDDNSNCKDSISWTTWWLPLILAFIVFLILTIVSLTVKIIRQGFQKEQDQPTNLDLYMS